MNAKLVVIGSYVVLAEAHIAQHALMANGIESVLQNEYLLDEGALPIELTVVADDVGRARAILEPLTSGLRARIDSGNSPPCPECGEQSTELTWKPPTENFKRLLSSFTHDLGRAEIRCRMCGHNWSVPW
jgi:Putative prokaryotic signal transducing protein